MAIPEVMHFIGGASAPSRLGRSFETRSPESDAVLASVARGSVDDANRAVDTAAGVRASLASTPPSARESWLLSAADLLQKESDAVAELLIDEIGSPIGKARMELAIATRVLKANAAMARRMTGRTYPSDVPGRWSIGVRRPVGVVLGITPFNVPLIKGIKAASMALATGNPFVWLPSDQAPLIADRVAHLFHSAGVPAGAMNVVHGHGHEIGDSLVSHPEVRVVAFTGSATVGSHVQRLCGNGGKRVTLELGGINPLVVLSDADLDRAVEAAIKGGFIYQGQICMSSSRVIIEAGLYDAFVERFVAAASALGTGELRDPATMIGPLINDAACERVRELIRDATDHGAQVLCGNQWTHRRLLPTVLAGVNARMRIHQEEVFGPVVSLYRADDTEHAMRLANDAPAILSASVFTQNLDAAMRFSEGLETSMVHLNDMTIQQEPEVPFGGEGQGGFGREGMETGIEDYTTWRWITVRG